VTVTALSAVVPRVRVTVAGRIIAVRAYRRPWMRLDVELSDGSGTIILRFMGRAAIPGMSPGRRVGAEGMPSAQGGALFMLNPHYAFVVDDDHAEQSSEDEDRSVRYTERSGGRDALHTDRQRPRPRHNLRGLAGHRLTFRSPGFVGHLHFVHALSDQMEPAMEVR
jgi:hypothetical protein